MTRRNDLYLVIMWQNVFSRSSERIIASLFHLVLGAVCMTTCMQKHVVNDATSVPKRMLPLWQQLFPASLQRRSEEEELFFSRARTGARRTIEQRWSMGTRALWEGANGGGSLGWLISMVLARLHIFAGTR
jgi:hypothetical protein